MLFVLYYTIAKMQALNEAPRVYTRGILSMRRKRPPARAGTT